MTKEPTLFGLMAAFESPEQLVAAARTAHANGYRNLDAYSPFPVDGLSEALGCTASCVPMIFLGGGVLGCLGGYFMEWFSMAVDYPINIGGRPLHSWPMFIPIAFELTILCSALLGFVGTLVLNKFPQPYHPVFNVTEFRKRASRDGFFLCIEATDPQFDRARTRQFLESTQPTNITEVEK